MQKVLKLHPHKHTGKVIHHRHTSYRALMVVLIAACSLMIFTSQIARASDLLVSATVPAPIPSGAPTFTSPAEGTIVDKPDVTFTGTCPIIDPAIIVALYDGTTLLGSDQCDTNGEFSILTTLAAGQRSIVAKVVTITGGFGDASTPLTITYTPPVPPTPQPPTTPTPTPTPYRMVVTSFATTSGLNSSTPIITFSTGQEAVWKGTINGGSDPYTVTVNWGDGTIDTIAHVSNEEQTYRHTYTKQGSYQIIITATDSKGAKWTSSYAAVSLTPTAAQVVTRSDRGSSFGSGKLNTQLYTGFVMVTALTLLLWNFHHFLYLHPHKPSLRTRGAHK